MKESIQTKKYQYHIILSFFLSVLIFLLFFISFEKNKFIPVHFHSWYSTYHIAYRFYGLDILERMKDDYKFIFEYANIISIYTTDRLMGTLFGIFFTLIHTFNLTYIRVFNFILIMICIIITLYFVKKRAPNDPRDIYFASLAWFTPYIIHLMRGGESFLYGMCFLFFYFYCITINYEHKRWNISVLSGILLLLAYASHRIMIIYASTMFVHVAFVFIVLVKNKKLIHYLNFLIASLIGLIPLILYYYAFKKHDFIECNVLMPILLDTPYLKVELLLAIDAFPMLIGSAGMLILIFSPFILKRLLQPVHKQSLLNIYLFDIIPLTFLLLPVVIIVLFSQCMDLDFLWYTPIIPLVLVLCVRIFHQLPSLFKTLILTIKLLVISMLLINNVFLCDVRSYIHTLYPYPHNRTLRRFCSRFFIHPYLSHNIDRLCYLHNYKNINILITNLFAKLDRTHHFIYVFPEGKTKLFNTLIETYAITHNKRILYSNELPSFSAPDTLYIALVADRSRLSIKDTSNPLFFEQFAWNNKNELAFLKPYLIKSSMYYTIPIDMFLPRRTVTIFKMHFGLKKYSRALLHADLPPYLRNLYIE